MGGAAEAPAPWTGKRPAGPPPRPSGSARRRCPEPSIARRNPVEEQGGFACAAGVCGAGPVAGVLLPSVDKVGRHFPLVAAAVPDRPAHPLRLRREAAIWYAEAEIVALDLLEERVTLEAALATLARIGPPAPAPGEPPDLTRGVHLDLGEAEDDTATAALVEALALASPDLTLWWTEGSPAVEASLLACAGLPRPDGFAAMLDGQWTRWGWGAC